jgi:hypothetical protein
MKIRVKELLRLIKECINEKKLKSAEREKLPDSAFALPGERKYPIHDKRHARNALARVAQHGTEQEKQKVRAAVKKKFPSIEISEEN